MNGILRHHELNRKRLWAILFFATLVTCIGCGLVHVDRGGVMEIRNELSEPVRLTVTKIHIDSSLPYDLSTVYKNTPWGWPNTESDLLEVGESDGSIILLPSEREKVLTKIIVSAWTDDGRVLYERFFTWQELLAQPEPYEWEVILKD